MTTNTIDTAAPVSVGDKMLAIRTALSELHITDAFALDPHKRLIEVVNHSLETLGALWKALGLREYRIPVSSWCTTESLALTWHAVIEDRIRRAEDGRYDEEW